MPRNAWKFKVGGALALALASTLGGWASLTPSGSKVVVSGAGPAGLLAARSILDHRPDVEVDVFEKRGDPRSEQISGFRAYSLGLNIRGRSALQHWPGLWEQVAKKGVLSDKFFLHLGGFQLQLRANREGGVPTLLIGRNDLCAALLEDLQERHGSRLSLHFGEALEEVDLSSRRCLTSLGTALRYDDLLGADGVNSAVRRAMAGTAGFRSDVVDLPGQFKVWVGPCPRNLDPLAVHAMSSKGLTLFSIPRVDQRLCTILSWNGSPPSFLEHDDLSIAQQLQQDFPSFGAPALESVAQLRQQRPSKATTVRANRYHDLEGRALLLGDAAHSTGGTLGQGANSALTDAVVLDELLKKATLNEKSVVQDVGEEFSKLRQPEGLALWKLLQLPPKGFWALPYTAAQFAAGLLSRGLPMASQPVQSLLSETTTPYTEIVSSSKFWLDKALPDAPGASSAEFESG